MDEVKVMDEQQRNESLNRHVELDTTQFIVAQLGGEQYGIDIKYISNIIRMSRITRVPKVSDYIVGVINVRGVVIPTISLRLKMGLPGDEITKKTRIIILTLEQHESIGVLVDEVKEVITLDEEHIEKMGYEGTIPFRRRKNGRKADLASRHYISTCGCDGIVNNG